MLLLRLLHQLLLLLLRVVVVRRRDWGDGVAARAHVQGLRLQQRLGGKLLLVHLLLVLEWRLVVELLLLML